MHPCLLLAGPSCSRQPPGPAPQGDAQCLCPEGLLTRRPYGLGSPPPPSLTLPGPVHTLPIQGLLDGWIDGRMDG